MRNTVRPILLLFAVIILFSFILTACPLLDLIDEFNDYPDDIDNPDNPDHPDDPGDQSDPDDQDDPDDPDDLDDPEDQDDPDDGSVFRVTGALTDTRWREILVEIAERGILVTLDLSACTMPTSSSIFKKVNDDGAENSSSELIQFNPSYSITSKELEGKGWIEKIILPNWVHRISNTSDHINLPDDYDGEIGGIENNAYKDFENLRYVEGSGVLLIGSFAFANIETLVSVNFPNTLHIYTGAFYGCTSLEDAIFEKTETVHQNAFRNCTDLETVHLPNIKSIEARTFMNSRSLRQVFSPSVDIIGRMAFKNCTSLKEAVFNNVTVISTEAFSGCTELSSISFTSATIIHDRAFENCNGLTEIKNNTFPLVTTIPKGAFRDCTSLETVSFASATIIGDDAFRNCTSLRTARFWANPVRDPANTGKHPLSPWIEAHFDLGSPVLYDNPSATTPRDPPDSSYQGPPFTSDSMVFYSNAFRGCTSLYTLDIRNAWNVYFASGVLAEVGKHLNLFLYNSIDTSPIKSYGHPQLEHFLGVGDSISLTSIILYVNNSVKDSKIYFDHGTPGYPSIFWTIHSWHNPGNRDETNIPINQVIRVTIQERLLL